MTWTPDRCTVEWAIGVLHEDRIAEGLRREVADRAHEADDRWKLVADIAVEHVSFDPARQLEEWERRDQSGN
jgi:hypothetical protein